MRLGAVMIVTVAALAVPAAAEANVDLQDAPGTVRVDGQASGDTAGEAVADAGDVNGDGKSDLIVGAPFAANNGRTQSGSAYVVYGGQNLASVDLQNLGTSGFRIDGAVAADNAGQSVAAAGDVNDDGIDDVIVGAPQSDNNNGFSSGSAYVVYGQKTADPSDVDLANITTTQASRGMKIDGDAPMGEAGWAVAGGADLNGDGIDDVVVGAPQTNILSGSVYVIYGNHGDASDVELANITTSQASRGTLIDGDDGSRAGFSVATGRDLNGDGVDDLLVGAPSATLNGRNSSGSADLVYGKAAADPSDVDLANITTTEASRGMRIDGGGAGDLAGLSVAAGGDANGDGHPDFVVGAPRVDDNGRTFSGSAYLLYGGATADPSDVDLATITTTQASRGMRIDGAAADDEAGFSVAAGGDVNGDGHPDFVVAAPFAANNGRTMSGSAYVVNGDVVADPSDIDLANITSTQASRATRIDGAEGNDETGISAAVGDINGDGHADAIVGANGADNNGRLNSGSAYVIDLAAPEIKIDSGPRLTNDPTPTFGFSAPEGSSFKCSIDQGRPRFRRCSGPGATDTPAAALADGAYVFRVAAIDAAGDRGPAAKRRFTVDTSAPETTITEHPPATLPLPSGQTTVEADFEFASSEPGSTFRCRLDKAHAAPCTSPATFTLAEGTHAVSVAATDAAGNQDPSAAKFELDVEPAQRAGHRGR